MKMNMKMISCIKSIGATGYPCWFNLKILAVAFGALVMSGAVCSAAFTDNFQNDTVGAPPLGWTITGMNGTTSTALVQQEGVNKYLALRDASTSFSLRVAHSDPGEAAGYFQFDIRINSGITNGPVYGPSGCPRE